MQDTPPWPTYRGASLRGSLVVEERIQGTRASTSRSTTQHVAPDTIRHSREQLRKLKKRDAFSLPTHPSKDLFLDFKAGIFAPSASLQHACAVLSAPE